MKTHIVVIEDNPALLSAVSEVLEDAGYQVTALNAIESLESLTELWADCFILDEHLPVVSGHIICIMLKSKPETADIPVILISGHEQLESITTLCKAEAFLKKPFVNISQITGAVAAVIEKQLTS